MLSPFPAETLADHLKASDVDNGGEQARLAIVVRRG
jgi:hypothetical protein